MSPRFLHTLARMEKLRSIVPAATAVCLTLGATSCKLMQVYLKPLRRRVFICPGTSDLACFEQVFLRGDYTSSYDIDPAVIIDAGANVVAATLFFADRIPRPHIRRGA